jgi:hypothetical protein
MRGATSRSVTGLPPRRADCEVDDGQGISLSLGEKAAFVCAGDTVLGGAKPLDYRQSVSVGLMRCDSTESGIGATPRRGMAS